MTVYPVACFTTYTIKSLISIPTATAAANVRNVMIFSLAKLKKKSSLLIKLGYSSPVLIGQFKFYPCKITKTLMSRTLSLGVV